MQLQFLFFVIWIFSHGLKNDPDIELSNNYCAKIDSLFCQRFYWKSPFVNETALIGALERKSKIYSSSEEKGVGGYVYYSDSTFMADIEKWRKFYNCTKNWSCSNRIFRP